MKRINLAVLMLFVTIATSSFSQKIIKLEGDLSFLSSAKGLNIVYDYSEMGVADCKTEEEYVNKKVEEHNNKEAGKGDKWKENWVNARELAYQPKFEELFNHHASKVAVNVSQNKSDAQYTLIVKTTFTEPGFNIGVARRPAGVSFEYIFVETGTDKVVAKYSQEMVPGSQAAGLDYDTSLRISESYAKAGKMLGEFISKNVK